MLTKKKGQSTIEYLLLVTAVVGVIIVFIVKGDSPFKKHVNDTLNSATSDMVSIAKRLATTHVTPPLP